MTSSTVSRWFAPNHEFYASLEDYAVVRASSTYIREAKTHADTGCNRIGYRNPNFADMITTSTTNPCYSFAIPGQLLYADVDEENPNHKADVYGRIAKEDPLEAESDRVKAVRTHLLEHVTTEWFESEIPPAPTEEEEGGFTDRKWRAKMMLGELLQDGEIDDTIIGYLMRAETETEKEDLLNILSGQTRRRTRRPVLMLIDMFDSMQTTEMGVTKGWVIGYDFLDDNLIIKPFLSTPDRHPLGGSWYGKGPADKDDGINYSGSPGTFVENYVLAANKHKLITSSSESASASASASASQSEAESQTQPFKTLIHTLAAHWILKHWSPLSSSPSTLFSTTSSTISKPLFEASIKILTTKLSTIPFVIQEKKEKSASSSSSQTATTGAGDDGKRRRVWRFNTFLQIQHLLENEEAEVREIALSAKRMGDEDVAMEAARVWEGCLEIVKGVNAGLVGGEDLDGEDDGEGE
jgi:hypothetical protein